MTVQFWLITHATITASLGKGILVNCPIGHEKFAAIMSWKNVILPSLNVEIQTSFNQILLLTRHWKDEKVWVSKTDFNLKTTFAVNFSALSPRPRRGKLHC